MELTIKHASIKPLKSWKKEYKQVIGTYSDIHQFENFPEFPVVLSGDLSGIISGDLSGDLSGIISGDILSGEILHLYANNHLVESNDNVNIVLEYGDSFSSISLTKTFLKLVDVKHLEPDITEGQSTVYTIIMKKKFNNTHIKDITSQEIEYIVFDKDSIDLKKLLPLPKAFHHEEYYEIYDFVKIETFGALVKVFKYHGINDLENLTFEQFQKFKYILESYGYILNELGYYNLPETQSPLQVEHSLNFNKDGIIKILLSLASNGYVTIPSDIKYNNFMGNLDLRGFPIPNPWELYYTEFENCEIVTINQSDIIDNVYELNSNNFIISIIDNNGNVRIPSKIQYTNNKISIDFRGISDSNSYTIILYKNKIERFGVTYPVENESPIINIDSNKFVLGVLNPDGILVKPSNIIYPLGYSNKINPTSEFVKVDLRGHTDVGRWTIILIDKPNSDIYIGPGLMIDLSMFHSYLKYFHITTYGKTPNSSMYNIVGLDEEFKLSLYNTYTIGDEIGVGDGNYKLQNTNTCNRVYSIDKQFELNDSKFTISNYYGKLEDTNWMEYNKHKTKLYVRIPGENHLPYKFTTQLGDDVFTLTFESGETAGSDNNLKSIDLEHQMFELLKDKNNQNSIIKYILEDNNENEILDFSKLKEICHIEYDFFDGRSIIGYLDQDSKELIVYTKDLSLNNDSYYQRPLNTLSYFFSKGIPHSWILLLDSTNKNENGEIDFHVNGTKLKNVFDHYWQTPLTPNNQDSLFGARCYTRIGKSLDNSIWLSYKYYQTKYDKIRNFEFAERINSFNVLKLDNLHKSNIFTINLNNSTFDIIDKDLIIKHPRDVNRVLIHKTSDEIKNELKRVIEESIFEVIEKIKPLHTEIIKHVEWNEMPKHEELPYYYYYYYYNNVLKQTTQEVEIDYEEF